MMKKHAVAVCIGLTLGLATQGWADVYWPKVEETRLDSCDARAGMAHFTFMDTNSRAPNVRLRSEICVSLEEGRFSGPENVSGLVKAEDYGEGAARYEVIGDSANPALRRRMSVTGLEGWIPFPFSPKISSISFDLAGSPGGPMPSANLVSGMGWLYDTSLQPLEALTPGRWLVSLYAFDRGEMRDTPKVNIDLLILGGAWAVLDVGDTGVSVTSHSKGWEDFDLTLAVADGVADAALSFRVDNPVLPAARGPRAYSHVLFEIPDFLGKALQTETGGAAFGVGSGRMVAYGDGDETYTTSAWVRLLAVEVPDSFDDGALAALISEN